MKKIKTKTQDRIAGNILSALLLLVMLGFLAVLQYTKMLPERYVGIIAAVLLVFLIICRLLTLKLRHTVRFIIGALLTLLLIAGLCFGGVYVMRTVTAIDTISGVNTQKVEMDIFVLNEDPAETLSDTSGYTFGILQDLDRTNTDKAIDQLKMEMGELAIAEYASLTDLADGLRNGESQAILLNQAYLDVIEQMDGYSEFSSEIRLLSSKMVELIVERVDPKPVRQPVQNTAEQESGSDTEDASDTASTSNRVYVLYISGVDTRGKLVSTSRSDVNIIATINLDTKQVLLVSTPRDYFVPLSISNGVPDKLTHAGIYGINVCEDTLGMLYDIDINYFFRMNFVGFVQLIDALGGVTVYSEYAFDTGGYHFVQGDNFVYGDAALAFVRERYSFAGGDRQRGKDQMAMIKAVINKCLSTDILSNYMDVLNKAAGSFETNVPYDLIASVVREQLKGGGGWNISSYSVDGTGDSQKPYSMSQKAYVMIPDQTTVDKAKDLMRRVREGELLTAEDVASTVNTN